MFKSFLFITVSSNRGQNLSAYLTEVSSSKLHCTKVSGSNVVTILSLMHWIINKDSPQLWNCSQTCIFKSKFSVYVVYTFQMHAKETPWCKLKSPARKECRISEQIWFQLCPHESPDQHSMLIENFNRPPLFLPLYVGAILFLSILQRTFIIGQHLKTLTLYLCSLLFVYYFIYRIKRIWPMLKN